MVSSTWKEWEGQVVDGIFPLQRLLGSGETTAVFLTQRGESEPQNAAIKLIPVDSENAERELTRWKRAGQLSHPHLVRLFETGVYQPSDTELLYAVMEYGDENLADILRDRPLQEAEARELLGAVLEALAYVHAQGLVHGHLRPANIMAVGDQVKLSSDGICEVGELAAWRGHGGMYDPPEFPIEGNSPAGDVWSLGVTLVEALTQQLPVRKGPHQDLSLPPTLPPVFVDIARRCLQPDPQRRAAVADIAARLRPAPLPVAQDQPVIPDREAIPPHEAQGRRYVRTAVVAGGIGVAALLVGSGILRKPAPPVAAQQPQPQPPTKTELESASRPVEPKPGPFQQRSSGNGKAPVAAATPPPAPIVAPHPESLPPINKGAEPGQVLRQVMPDVPRQARDTIHGTVRISVRASVDSAGHVVKAELDSPGPSQYLARLTLQAARQWEFQPAKSQGKQIPAEWVLRFDLTRTGTTVRPAETR